MNGIIVGLSGYAQTGKDSVGKAMMSLGYSRYAFADQLKRCLYALNPAVGENKTTGAITYLKPLWDAQTGDWDTKWNKVKSLPEVRRLLQRLGTEVGREILGEDIWVDTAFRQMESDAAATEPPHRAVFTDMRFPNEAQAITRLGGVTIRVHRPDVGPMRGNDGRVHQSEVALDQWLFDYNIYNEGSLADLNQKVRNLVSEIEKERLVFE